MIKAEFNESINDLTTENLYQWDSYQTLVISGIVFDGVTPKVHFCNKKSTEALAVQGILKEGGICEVSIPNSLLSEKYDILAYIYTNTGLTYKTIKSITIPIIPRLKPTNYTQPSNEEIAEIEEIELQAKAILNGFYISDYDQTKSYQRPNIVYYQYSSYMCTSDTPITGVLPTDTNKWKLVSKGSMLTNLTKDDNGNLVFTFNDNSSYTIQIAVVETETADDTTIPALKLTNAEVTKIKNNVIVFDSYKNHATVPESNIAGSYEIHKKGLYSIVFNLTNNSDVNMTFSIVADVPSLVGTEYLYGYLPYGAPIKYCKVNEDTNSWGFMRNITNVTILSVYCILEYND